MAADDDEVRLAVVGGLDHYLVRAAFRQQGLAIDPNSLEGGQGLIQRRLGLGLAFGTVAAAGDGDQGHRELAILGQIQGHPRGGLALVGAIGGEEDAVAPHGRGTRHHQHGAGGQAGDVSGRMAHHEA